MMLRQMISALPQRKFKSHFLSLQAVLKDKVRRLSRDALGRMLDGAGQLVAVSRIPVSIWLVLALFRWFRIWVRNLKVCWRNAIGQMLVNVGTAGQLALLSRTWLFVHLVEWLFAWHPCKNGLDSQRRTQISAKCGSPEISSEWHFWPVGLDGNGWSFGTVKGPLEDRRKYFWESMAQTSYIKVPLFFPW